MVEKYGIDVLYFPHGRTIVINNTGMQQSAGMFLEKFFLILDFCSVYLSHWCIRGRNRNRALRWAIYSFIMQ